MHLATLIFIVVTLCFSGIEGGADQLNSTTRKSCPLVKCPGGKPKQCAYGYQKKDGCEICSCDDPCNPPGRAILCGPKQRCFIDKKDNGTFVARCDNPSQKTKPNKNNKKNKKGNQHAKIIMNVTENVKWAQNGRTVAGGYESGNAANQLNVPYGLHVDEDQTIYIADLGNHRIVKWKLGAMTGEVVAGGNGEGNRLDQLKQPVDMIVDKETDSLIISDWGNGRVVRWSRRNRASGEIIIDNIKCYGLAMDNQRYLYIADSEKHEVRRYRVGETRGTVVAGGNGEGDRLNQLNTPIYIFVDQDYSVYISDSMNNRVMKWEKDATEGIVVAGGQGHGNNLTQFATPQGVFADALGAVYVSDSWNFRVMRWSKGATEGKLIAGGNDPGEKANQLRVPIGLSFDRQGNLYVVDYGNSRVQQFSIEQ